MKLQYLLSDPNSVFTKDNVDSIEQVILLQPPSPVRDSVMELLASRSKELNSFKSMEASMSNKIKEGLTEAGPPTGLGLDTMPDIDPTLGKGNYTKIKQSGYNSIDDVLLGKKQINIPGIMKTLKDTVKQDLKYFGPVNITDVQEYVKETIPVVKKAAKQFIDDAPAKIKKAAKVVSDEANDALTSVAKTDKYITSGELGIDLGFAKDEAVEGARQFAQDWITLGQNASEKVKEFYDATEDARKDIKDQAKLMTFYDDFTSTNWNVVKQDIADSYIQFANENNIDITKAVQKGTAVWLAKMIEDTMPISGRTAAQISLQRQKFKMKQDAAQRKIDLFNMKQDVAQDIVGFTKDSSKNIGLLARREDSEEN